MRVLVTGGAGFVGSSLALAFKRDHPQAVVTVLDNLRRRGSDLNLPRLRRAGIGFEHGDVRAPDDIAAAGPFDLLLECSAEPSVHAGYGEAPGYVVQTNLVGTVHCLDAARRHGARVVFLSSSRVYPIAALRALPLEVTGQRLAPAAGAGGPGWSEAGISTDFPLAGSRSLYGATKLASELIAEEYAALYGLRVVVDRCGVLAGPWQMGKVDQGFVALWAQRHLTGGRLAYMGFGGHGHQVRDLLHVTDLYDLILRQLADTTQPGFAVHNVGGGLANSVSLAEMTDLCRARAGRGLDMGAQPDTRAADIPWYVTDIRAVSAAFDWRPRRPVALLLDEVFDWLRAGGPDLLALLD